MRTLLSAVAAALLLPAAASAATVTVEPSPDQNADEVHYIAASGERNDLLVAYAGDARSVTVTDPGATIAPSGSWSAVDAHTAICVRRPETFSEYLQATRAELGDGDDRLATTRPGPVPIGGVIAFGGPATTSSTAGRAATSSTAAGARTPCSGAGAATCSPTATRMARSTPTRSTAAPLTTTWSATRVAPGPSR